LQVHNHVSATECPECMSHRHTMTFAMPMGYGGVRNKDMLPSCVMWAAHRSCALGGTCHCRAVHRFSFALSLWGRGVVRSIVCAPGALQSVLPHPAGIAKIFQPIYIVGTPEGRKCDPTHDARLKHAHLEGLKS